ncbi:MAG: dienelactone hydrolase family protein [Candidatus Obscuribacterales bacterium]|nr:dienelactone hydrolase family protein [Candidatus Obscuribacterales bacterium]
MCKNSPSRIRKTNSRGIAVALVLAVFSQLPESVGAQVGEPQKRSLLFQRDAQQDFISIAGLKVAVWQPQALKQPAPLVIFSHGFHGRNTQSSFLMTAMAKAGYLVMAPDHDDANTLGKPAAMRSEVAFKQADCWSETTYKKRGQDIENLLAALHKDPNWSKRIDWPKVALCGHSLGGYTVLGLAGAWSSWKIPEVKAVLALSPYCEPFIAHDTFGGIKIPVMYQGGTRDFGITPSVKRRDGAFAKTGSPSYFVEFEKMGHLGWTGFNQNANQQDLIDFYSIAFLDKYLKGDKSISLDDKRQGVAELTCK